MTGDRGGCLGFRPLIRETGFGGGGPTSKPEAGLPCCAPILKLLVSAIDLSDTALNAIKTKTNF